MQLFVLNTQVDQLAHELVALQGEARLKPLLHMAWHMRQRDGDRALALCLEVEALMEALEPAADVRSSINARLGLIRAEISMLFAKLDDAQQLALSASQAFRALGDSIGVGDTCWVQAHIHSDLGNLVQVNADMEEALACYTAAGDVQRVRLTQARQLVNAAFVDPLATCKNLEAQFPLDTRLSPDLSSWVCSARANVYGLTNDMGQSLKYDLAAHQFGLDSGQIRQTLVALVNASESFATLGDLDGALEWSDHALALARKTRWPGTTGLALMQVGDVMRLLGRYPEAKECLQEALVVADSLKGSRNYHHILEKLAQLSLSMGDFAASLQWFIKFEAEVLPHQEADLIVKAWHGQASALQRLQRFDEAAAKAGAALALARERGNAEGQIQALNVLAHNQPQGAAPSLQYLNEALSIARGIHGYTIPPETLLEVAATHAAGGAYQAAYESALQAIAARNQTRTAEAQSRALAMQVRQEVERARADAESHRQVAATLRETAATLETLGTIGREITSSLDAQAVFDTLYRHVDQLLDATTFAVYLIDEAHKNLVPAFAVEAGKPMPARTIALANPNSKSARAARKRQEIIINLQPGERNSSLLPGTLETVSLMYFPLTIGERLLGVMTIQSDAENAYGEREQSIFRALCAYSAIALDNAAAYSAAETAQQRADQALEALRDTQVQLVQQNEQLARVAVTDQLTGLFNRLQLDRTLEEEHSRNLRYGTHFCVVLLDVDEFKQVNDTYGHQTGDEVLVGIAQTLKEGIREVDVVGRWGGEEFLIICRETVLQGALVMAEKLRHAIEMRTFDNVGTMTTSFGVSEFRMGEVLTETLARADLALYRAKRHGRNRVESGEEEDTPSGAAPIFTPRGAQRSS